MTDLLDPERREQLEAESSEDYLGRREFLQRTAMAAGLAASAGLAFPSETLVAEAARRQRRVHLPSPRNLPVDMFVVLMMENRSFDHYLGWLPRADGRQGGLSYVDRQGARHSTFRLAPDFQGCGHPDPDHGWDDGRKHVNGGRMDGFLRSRGSDEFAVGYYAEQDLPFIGHAAKASTAFDRFFCSLLGPTFPNRYYMHAAQSYGLKDNRLPPDAGYPYGFPDNTIFAALRAKGIDSRYFFNDLPASGLWGRPAMDRSSRVEEYYQRCLTGTLPALSFVDPQFANASGGTSADEHPHGDIRAGQAFMSDVVHAFMSSPQWRRGALFIVYDEWGGFFDHVRPPRVPDNRGSRKPEEDFGQMGIRIPAVAASPYLRRGHVAHSVYGFESILKMVEYKFGLKPLTRRDAYARNIARSFDWQSRPRLDPLPIPDAPLVASAPCARSPGEGEAAQRTGEHDLLRLRDSGYLESLGFEYRPATPSSTFREPSKVTAALESGG